MKKNKKLLFIFSALILIDQLVKTYFSSGSVCNKNIAWGIPIAPAIFYLTWIAIIAVLICIFCRTKNYTQKILLALILSGAVSNLIDRIRLGCVVDYIDLKFWPIFNLADAYITVGIISFILVIASVAKQSR